MLSGDNGILQKATQSKEKTERAEIIETAQMDILGVQAKNHGTLSEDELEEILVSPNYNTQGSLSDEESILDRTLTSKDEKYKIPVLEIYNGTLTNIAPSVVSDYSNEVKTTLSEGKYVTYKNKTFVVLYNNNDGIEIIAMDSMGTVTLGQNDETEGAQGTKGEFSRAQWSYNNAISTLNKVAENLFPSDNIIDDARCVGSVPGKTGGISNKNNKNSTKYVHGTYNSYFSAYDNQFEEGEELYENGTKVIDNPNDSIDYNKMESLGITNINADYWLASRTLSISSGEHSTTQFNIGQYCYVPPIRTIF